MSLLDLSIRLVCLLVCLSVSLSYLSVCLCVCLSLSVCLPACLPACLHVCLFLCLSVCMSVFTPIYLSLSLFVPITLSTSVTIPVPNVPEALILMVGQPLVLDCGDAIFTFLIDSITSLLDIEFPFPVLNITSVTLVDTGYYICVAGGAPRSVTLVTIVPSKQCINC